MSKWTRVVTACAMAAILAMYALIPAAVAQNAEPAAPATPKVDDAPTPVPAAALDQHKSDGWLTSLDEAKKQAAAEGKPIFIDFFAVWCGPCKMLDAQTFSDEGVKALLAKFVTVRIDVDKDQATSMAYAVSAMPTLVAAGADGKPLVRHTGFIPPEPMKQFLGDVLKFSESLAAYTKDTSNAEALFQLADLCSRTELTKDEKLAYIDAALKLLKPDDSVRQAKLKLSRGLVVAMSGDAPDQAIQSLQEAAKLDAENAEGIREQAEWYLGLLSAGPDGDPAKLRLAVEKFLAAYPKEKLKNPDLRLQGTLMIFQMAEQDEDYKTAIRMLELLKAEFAEKLGADKIEQALAAMKEAQKEQQGDVAPEAPQAPAPSQPEKAPDAPAAEPGATMAPVE